jgi:hypothetical protein
MKARTLAMLFVFILLAAMFGASQGLAHMRASYNGVCGELDGLPGLLQKMNFFAQGTCDALKGKTPGCANPNSACTIKMKSGTVNGTCQLTGNGCTCVAN